MPFHGQNPEPWQGRPLRTFTWRDWGGHHHTIKANYINFTGGHVAFWVDREPPACDQLVLAARNEQINNLMEEP